MIRPTNNQTLRQTEVTNAYNAYYMISESQIYMNTLQEFYNVVFSTYLGSNAAEKRV